MASISTYLNKIKTAVYGKDVRSSIHDAIDAINKESENTKQVAQTATNAALEVGAMSAIQHRNIYRGKNLGTSVAAEQIANVRNGTFKDLFIGDYWTINGTRYNIADMDYWYHCGDTDFTKHHLVMIPDRSMYNAVMNENATTDGGYVGSKMYTENLERAKTTIKNAFNEMLLLHRELFSNGSGYIWENSEIDLMNEIMIYGCYIHAIRDKIPSNGDSLCTIDNLQLAIFRLYPGAYKKRMMIWLRDSASERSFALCRTSGEAIASDASNSLGVLPVFAIG